MKSIKVFDPSTYGLSTRSNLTAKRWWVDHLQSHLAAGTAVAAHDHHHNGCPGAHSCCNVNDFAWLGDN